MNESPFQEARMAASENDAIAIRSARPFRLYTGPAVHYFVTSAGVVISATLPLTVPQAKSLRAQGARLLRRSERRALVPSNEWRDGRRAPDRVEP